MIGKDVESSMIGKTEDRISNLPDSLLHHILSSLETKIVARTSVLSHRWYYIWTSIPNLEFQWERRVRKNNLFYPISSNTEQFIDFVGGTLHRHSLSDTIEKFCLESSEPLSESLVNSWISNVMTHNTKDFSLFLEQKHPLCIPQSVFTCESLTSLQLRIHPDIHYPKCISFPKLKHLQLNYIKFSKHCWNEKLFSDCPVLEELYLLNCEFRTWNFCISIRTLKTLKMIISPRGINYWALKIHAPNLLSLFCKGPVARKYVFSSFVTLAEAFVQIFVHAKKVEARHVEALRQFLEALTNVRRLTVQNPHLKVFNLFRTPPTYQNIKRLEINRVVNSDAVVIALLKVTPNLESLIFEKKDPFWIKYESEENHDKEDDGWTSLDTVATASLFLCLKSFFFKPIHWSSNEMICAEVILRKAKALQSMTIYHDFSKRPINVTEQELMVLIESFPRASASCMFKISP